MASVTNGSYENFGGPKMILVHAYCPKCGRNVSNYTCGPSSVNSPAKFNCRCNYCGISFTVTVIND